MTSRAQKLEGTLVFVALSLIVSCPFIVAILWSPLFSFLYVYQMQFVARIVAYIGIAGLVLLGVLVWLMKTSDKVLEALGKEEDR